MQKRQRKPRIDLIGYKNSHGIVIDVGPPGKFKLKCNYCGKNHIQSSREIQKNARSRSCEKFKPHNWTGLSSKDRLLRNTYGITLEKYFELVDFQGGGCSICGREKEPNGIMLSVDHDHTTGKVRGILCYSCNKALGLFYDDIKNLERAINYLKNPPTNTFILNEYQ